MPDWKALDGANELFPRILPSFWHELERGDDGAAYRSNDGLVVICSAAIERDGRRWLHVSTSLRDRLPSWKELGDVKDLFIGAQRKAIQVLPPADEHYNHRPNCLHLWSCLDEDPLPDFRKRGVL